VIGGALNGGPALGHNLADYRDVHFTDVRISAASPAGSVTHGSLRASSLWTVDRLANYFHKALLAAPGPLSTDGRAFEDVWHASG
jgi:hypothetical protein